MDGGNGRGSGAGPAATVLELEVGPVASGGWCVARRDGKVVFVRHALPGERVRARVLEETSRLVRAEAVAVLAASPDRVEAPCPYAGPGRCGGCDWQHASLAAQRRMKAAVVQDQLARIAGLVLAVTVEVLPVAPAGGSQRTGPGSAGDGSGPGSAGDGTGPGSAGDGTGPGSAGRPDGGLGWRTRVQFAVGRDGVVGFRRHRSHDIEPVRRCLIAHQEIDRLGVAEQRWPGAERVEVAVSAGTGDRVVAVDGRDAARIRVPRLGAPVRLVRGAPHPGPGLPYVREVAAGRTWQVSGAGFWQVHPGAAQALSDAVLDGLRPRPGDTVLDLYCGVGLFLGALAAVVGPSGTLTGVEEDPLAVRDARHNLRDLRHASIRSGRVDRVLDQVHRADLVVLDPPRAGAGRHVVRRVARLAGRAIAYVSCDPATLARDLAFFAGHGWALRSLRAFDAFPMTHHVECVAILRPNR